jgi:CRP/FNR family transcriptional regulator, cyclic AMP receptor protein
MKTVFHARNSGGLQKQEFSGKNMENKKIIHSSFWSNFFRPKHHTSEIEQLLKTLPPFSELGRKDIRIICSLLQTRNYLAGEYIFYQGDPGIGLYMIDEGEVEIQRIDDEGNTFSMANFIKGDFFGEMALVDGEKRSASAVAKSDCRLAVLFKPDLDEFIEKYPKKGIKILQGFSLIIISRLRELNEDYFHSQREINREKIHGTQY